MFHDASHIRHTFRIPLVLLIIKKFAGAWVEGYKSKCLGNEKWVLKSSHKLYLLIFPNVRIYMCVCVCVCVVYVHVIIQFMNELNAETIFVLNYK
jgi:hypothetical protein